MALGERRLIGRRAELERLVSEIVPASLRVVPVVVGPSGIGKTSLAREAARRLHLSGYLAFHIQVTERIETLEDLYRVLASRIGLAYSSLFDDVVRAIFSRVAEKFFGSDWREKLGTVGLATERSIYDILYEFFLGLAVEAGRRHRKGVVVFIDEAQNIIRSLEPGDVWSFVKMLASLQEELPSSDAAGLQAVLVTSEYGFQQRLLRYSPSPDYVDTYYLGEMTRGDALALYRYMRARGTSKETGDEETVVEAVGGHPVHLAAAARRSPGSTICRNVRKIQQLVTEYLLTLEEGERRQAEEALRRLAEEPLQRSIRSVELLDELVKRGVLQYGCKAYTGIYSWNRDCEDQGNEHDCGGGGWCGGLDVVAPAHRLARLGILLATGLEHRAPPIVRHLCGF